MNTGFPLTSTQIFFLRKPCLLVSMAGAPTLGGQDTHARMRAPLKIAVSFFACESAKETGRIISQVGGAVEERPETCLRAEAECPGHSCHTLLPHNGGWGEAPLPTVLFKITIRIGQETGGFGEGPFSGV